MDETKILHNARVYVTLIVAFWLCYIGMIIYVSYYPVGQEAFGAALLFYGIPALLIGSIGAWSNGAKLMRLATEPTNRRNGRIAFIIGVVSLLIPVLFIGYAWVLPELFPNLG